MVDNIAILPLDGTDRWKIHWSGPISIQTLTESHLSRDIEHVLWSPETIVVT